MDETKALMLRIQRERAARIDAELLLEHKSKELHASVNESKRLTEQLKKTVQMQTRELLSAQRVTNLGTFIWDTGKNSISWSDGGCKVLGLDPSNSNSTFAHFLSIIHPDDRYLMQQLYELLHKGIDAFAEPVMDTDRSFRVVLPDQSVRWIKFVWESTDLESFTGAVQDITDSVLAAEDVRQARLELEQRLSDLEAAQAELKIAHEEAQKANATKSRFIAMISHDIRTPINGLLGTLTLLNDSELGRSQRELLQVAKSSAESLRVLVNDVIDFARLEAGQIQLEPANFNIRELVSQLNEFWRPLASSANNRIESKIDDGVPGVLRGDPIRLGQILNNLLSNAIKFTNDGSITLGIRPDDTRASSPTKRDLIIEVTDTGVGIEKSDQANLFKDFSQIPLETSENDPFLDLSGSRHGAGLGLAICRTLVTQMGGRISVMSSSGKGATFAIRLALEVVSDADPIEKPAELHPLVTADGKAPHALIAEDVPANQLVSRMLLESFGCHVEIANDGVDAVDACKKRTYDFVLMDVSMPRLDGIAATEQIRALQGSGIGELPIIGLTAFAFAHEKQRFIEAGMNEVVCKPVLREELYAAVSSALSGAGCSVSSTGEDAGNAVIDFGVLMALTSGLNDGQLRKIVQQFIDDLDKYRREAIKEAKNGNITKLARACHAVKGLASSSGSQALANLASAIEDAAREGDSELAVAYTIDRLNRTTDESLKTLNEYLAKFQPLSNAS